MKIKINLLLAIIFVISSNLKAQGPFSKLMPDDPALNKAIDQVRKDLQPLIDQAMKNGDYVLEKNLSRLNLMLSNLYNSLSSDLERKISKIGKQASAAINAFDKVAEQAVNNVSGKLMTLQDFLNMNIQNWVNSIPFVKDKIYVFDIQGSGQRYQKNGYYTVSVLGNGFRLENIDSVYVDGKPLNKENVDIQDKGNQISFQIPAAMLQKKFSDTKMNRVEFTVKSFSIKKKQKLKLVYAFSSKILLLPKLTVTSYNLEVYSNQTKWSDKIYDVTGTGIINPNGGGNAFAWATVDVSVPDGCLILRDQIAAKTDGIWAGCINGNYKFSDNDTKVTTSCWHQYSDRTTKTEITVHYRKPEVIRDGKPTKGYLTLHDKMIKGGLPTNTYLYDLPENYSFYRLDVTLFNGQTYTFVPGGDMQKNGISTSVSEDGKFYKLVVVVGDQM